MVRTSRRVLGCIVLVGLALWRFASPTLDAGAETDNPIAWGSISPTPALAGDAITLSGFLALGKNPASVSVAITCDLTQIGGSDTQAMTVSGTTWSYTGATVPTTMVPGHYQLPCHITDDRNRTTAFTLALFVQLTPDPACGTTATPINVIQGSGATSTMVGQTVDVEGIVFGSYQAAGQRGGFFLQEPFETQDSDPATSEGIFIQATTPVVPNGYRVHVHGTVAELTSTRGSRTSSLTSLVSADVRACSMENEPTAIKLLTLPLATDLERYEGTEIVFVLQPMLVAGTNDLGSRGEMQVSTNIPLQPTQTPGDATSWAAQADLNARSTLTLDDGSVATGADLNGGGVAPFPSPGLSATNSPRLGQQINPFGDGSLIAGIVDDRDGGYRLIVEGVSVVSSLNTRPDTSADTTALGGRFRIASAHTLNYFTMLGSRGAQTSTELDHQRTKLVAQLSTLHAAVIGLSGVQNFANGQSSGGTYTNAAVTDLTAALSTATGHTWQIIDTINAANIVGGTVAQNGSDAVRSVILYDTSAVTPVGKAALYGQNDANHPSLAQTFKPAAGLKADTQTFTVVMNDFASRATACGGTDDDPYQGNCNGVRSVMAGNVRNWLGTNPTADPAGSARRVLLIGDFNSYFGEDPIQSFVGANGYTNLIALLNGATAYTASDDGQVGYLDHALANAAMLPLIKSIAEPKINADEPPALQALDSADKSATAQAAYYAADEFASADRNPVVIAFNPLAGDVNDDGVVDFTDRDLIVAAEGQSATAVDRRLDFDGDGTITSNDVTVWQNDYTGFHSPQVSLLADPTAGQTPLSVVFVATASDPDNDPLTYAWTFGDGQTATGVSSVTHVYANPGTYTATVTVSDGASSAQASATITVSQSSGEPLPPDPATVAPPVNPTVATNFANATSFLYSGTDPIQRGVAPGAIEQRRVAVLRGRVLNTTGAVVSGARITVLNASGLGHTLSRVDGAYDIAVNGGVVVTVTIEKDGYLPVQRRIITPTHDYATVDDVRLTALDPVVTEVHFDTSSTGQLARGSVVTDADGQRQATLIVPEGGVHADLHLPNGTVLHDQASLHIRATEYTVGPNGPQAMPGNLPGTSGYTYAVELSADEVTQAGATSVSFSPALPFYVENFIGFPVGMAVPVGSYDKTTGSWTGAPNGRVIKVLSVNASGLADLDVDGSGQPADATTLGALGITDGERRQVATLYQPGQSLWRVQIAHFSPWDCNWAFGPPSDAQAPDLPQPESDDDDDQSPTCGGSLVECATQTLGERVSIAGTPLTLNYRSNRQPGRTAAAGVGVVLTKSTVPASLARIEVKMTVAGQTYTQTFAPGADLRTRLTWPGLDAYGRPLFGRQPATVQVSHIYQAAYYSPATFESSFAVAGNAMVTPLRARQQIALSQSFKTMVASNPAPRDGLGGWSIDAHHVLDTNSSTVLLGSGDRIEGTMSSVAASRQTASGQFMDVGPDGSLLLSGGSTGLLRVLPDGQQVELPYTPLGCGLGNNIDSYVTGPDGTIYHTSRDNHTNGEFVARTFCVGRIEADGTERRLVSIEPPRTWNDDFNQVILAIAPTGEMYVAAGPYMYQFGSQGENPTLLRDDSQSPTYGDGTILGMNVGPDGSLYYTQGSRIFRRKPSGERVLLGGTDTPGPVDEGVLATTVHLIPYNMTLTPDGSVWFVDVGCLTNPCTVGARVRRIWPNGIITTVAGGGLSSFADRGPAVGNSVSVVPTSHLRVSPNGATVYLADLNSSGSVYRFARTFQADQENASLAISKDGQSVYLFDAEGRHQGTFDALTGVTQFSFDYDTAGRLIGVHDVDNRVTTLEYDGGGHASAIVGPFGDRTTLTMNPDGYVSSVTDPAGDATGLTYAPGGLLTTLETPRHFSYQFSYDADGRLSTDQDPAGGLQTLGRTPMPGGSTTTLSHNVGITQSFQSVRSLADDQRRAQVLTDGTTTTATDFADGHREELSTSGMRTLTDLRPDPRFGMLSPIATSQTSITPAGLSRSETHTRQVTLADPSNALSVQQVTETNTSNGHTTTTTYDAIGHVLTVTSPAGRQAVLTLDDHGRTLSATVGNLPAVTFTYNAAGQMATSSQGTRTTTYGYNPHGLLQTVTDPIDQVSQFSYDDAGRVLSESLPGGRTIGVQYDSAGNAMSVTAPEGAVHGFSFTPVDLGGTYTPPALPNVGLTMTSYRGDRLVDQVTRADGTVLTVGYDASGRIQTLSTPSGAIGWTYDATSGRVSGVTAPDAVLTHTYDGDLPLSETWSGSVTGHVDATWNSDFRPASQSVNGGAAITFDYDADGLVTRSGQATIARDPSTGVVKGITVGNAVENRTFDAFGNLASREVTVNGNNVYTVSFTRDGLGRIATKTETIGAVSRTDSYLYDDAGRLRQAFRDGAPITNYSYDRNGNRIAIDTTAGTVTAAYDAQDRLTSQGSEVYTYTASGELATRSIVGQPGATTYAYDALSNLRSVTLSSGTTIAYLIDGVGRRIGRSVDGVRTHTWLYGGGGQPVAELDGGGAVVTRYVYGSNVFAPDYMVRGGVTYRFVSDQLGSTRLVINAATGVIAQELDYDAWGHVLSDSNPGFQPFGYAGGLYDPLTGLVHFQTREYDPVSGRWTTKDSLGLAAGVNVYAYVLDDPINRLDPDGTDWWDNVIYDGGNFLTGAADGFSFGIGGYLRREFFPDFEEAIDPCSLSYRIGTYAPLVMGAARGAYAGLAKVASFTASSAVAMGAEAETAARSAVLTRNLLKVTFRGGLFPRYRWLTYAEAIASKKTAAGAIASAGRTSPFYNGLGFSSLNSGLANKVATPQRCCRH